MKYSSIILIYFIANIICRNIKYITTPLIFNNVTKEEMVLNFENYKYYETLQINNVNITNIDDNIFKHIRYSLKNLTINNCNTISIEKLSFENFDRLYYLHIINNNLVTFNSVILSPISYLEKLDLSNNNIQQLNVTYNSHSFKTFILNNNNFTALNKNTFHIKCQYLKILIIQNCRINYIESGIFHNLPKLLILDMRDNLLEFIESNTFLGLSKLNDLILMNSNIEDIKYNAFNGLVQIKKLNLENNLISKKSMDYFTEMENLEEFDLSFNTIEMLDQNMFKNLNKLLLLHLNNNIISEIPCRVFNGMHLLTKLNLSYNVIKVISICAFESLNHLTNLNLQHNNLTHIQIGTFSGLRSLMHLDLSYNKFSSLEETVIHPLENLEIIDISSNKFKSLNPVPLLDNLESLHQIDFSGNNWDCANLTSLIKYLKTQNINYESKLINFEKENIEGIQCYYDTNNKTENLDNNLKRKNDNFNDKLLEEKYFNQIIINELQLIRNNTSSTENEKKIQEISSTLQEILNITTINVNFLLSKLVNNSTTEDLKNIQVQKFTNLMHDDGNQKKTNLNIIVDGIQQLNYRIHIFVIAFIILTCFVICCCSFKLFKPNNNSDIM